MLNVWFAYHNIRQMNEDEILVIHTQNVMSALESILSLAKDAETGQRGYIIIGEPTYLEPYNAAVASINERLKLLEQAHPRQPWATGSPPGLENQIANRLDIGRTDRFANGKGIRCRPSGHPDRAEQVRDGRTAQTN